MKKIVFIIAFFCNILAYGQNSIEAMWCSIGTSITWYNNHPEESKGKFTKGYQSRVLESIDFKDFYNAGVNGGVIATALGALNEAPPADYYTIEHGINDWGHSVPVGTINDYIYDTRNGTFAATYRILIDSIFRINPYARIVICTPRKGYGFDGYLPEHWYDAKNGIYLKDYVDVIRLIAEYESIPVADFFAECGAQHNLHLLSIDNALHPNDDGYQLMANVLIQALRKVIIP